MKWMVAIGTFAVWMIFELLSPYFLPDTYYVNQIRLAEDYDAGMYADNHLPISAKDLP